MSFDKTFDAFKSALRWADDTCKRKLESLRLAIAICVGHPQSLLLLSVISKYSDRTVWFWIQLLSDLMVGKFLGDIYQIKILYIVWLIVLQAQNLVKIQELLATKHMVIGWAV